MRWQGRQHDAAMKIGRQVEQTKGEQPQAAGRTFEPLPAGDYELMIVSAEETTSKAGRDVWKFTMSPIAESISRRKIWHYIVLGTEYFQESLERICDATGVTLRDGDYVPAIFVNKTLKAKLRLEEFNNKLSEKIAFIFPRDDSQREEDAIQAGEIDDASIPF